MSNRSNRAKCGSTPSHCDVKIRRTCACATSSTSFPASSNGLTVAIASRVRAAASSTVSPGPLCTGTCSPFGKVSIQSPSNDSGSDLRTVAPHIPSETARRAHILTRTALRHGRNPIPRFQGSTSKSPYPASCAVCWALRNGLANMHPCAKPWGNASRNRSPAARA